MRRNLMSVLLVGALLGGSMAATGCGEAERAKNAEESAARDAEVEALRAETERLQRAVALHERREQHAEDAAERARAALEEVTRELDTPEGEAPEGEGVEEDTWQNRLAAYPAYPFEEFDEALGGVDWVTVGGNMSAMPPLIAQLAAALAEGKGVQDLPPDLVGRIQQLNGPLVTAALNISQKGVPGTGVNGSFSHPAFMGNAIAASLEAIGKPLDADQARALDELARDYTRREAERVGALDESGGLLTGLLAESDLKRDFFAQAHTTVLTEEQHAALRPEATRGRLQLDIYSEGLVWTGRAGPLVFTDRAELSRTAGEWITNRAGLQAQGAAAVMPIVEDWVDGLPEELVSVEVDRLSASGMMQVSHVVESGRAVERLQDALIAGLDLDEAGVNRVRAVPGTIVLYRRAETR